MNKSMILSVLFYVVLLGNTAWAGGILATGMWNQKVSVKVKQVVAGQAHTCALLDNSTVKCWGRNEYGQLGQGSTESQGDGAGEMGDRLPAINLGTGRKAVQIAAGQAHTCALLDNSTVKCWGRNDYGQIGQGSTESLGDGAGEMGDSLATVNLGTSRSAVQIAAYHSHSCALLDDSTVKCWGANYYGQLGQGSLENKGDEAGEMGDSLAAVNLGTGRRAVQIAVGSDQTCAILDNSKVKCWGRNYFGQLGLGNTADKGDSAGEMGDSLPEVNLGTGQSALQLVAGDGHTCALLGNSTVKCWGFGDLGQLGQGSTDSLGDGAGEMGDSLPAINLGTDRKAVQISAGGAHTCAILDNSTVKCWGFGDFGQLGQGNTEYLGNGVGEMGDSLPAINLGTGRFAVQIAAGESHSCALLDNSTLKCWGYGESGQLGQGSIVNKGDGAGEMGNSLPAIQLGISPSRIAKVLVEGTSKNKDVRISASSSHACVLLENSTIKCWGFNSYGQLGQGSSANLGDGAGEMGDSLRTINLGTARSAKQVAAGGAHTCAILDDSTVKCWGYNMHGQLGLGSGVNKGDGAGEMGDSLPTVNLGTGRSALQIVTGNLHSCALLDNSTVKCWGRNNYGQLGQGSTASLGDGAGEMGDSLLAIDLGTGRSAIQISAGGFHTCAILDDSTVKCWGNNVYGQLGQGSTANLGDGASEMGDSLLAINLGTGRKAVQVMAGAYSTCAILDDSTAKCWGQNSYGALGQGHVNNLGDGASEMGDSLAAISLGAGRTPVQISTGLDHTCAILDNSTMKCWGGNLDGTLGLGNTLDKGDGAGEMGDNLPAIDLGAGRSSLQMTTGAYFTCAILDNSTLKCWGANANGNLGQGNTTKLGDGAGEMGDSLKVVTVGTSK